MAKKLTKNLVRRTEKTLSNVRPDIPPIGTNHVDDSSLWTDNALYKGELGLHIPTGEIFTQDDVQPVAFGRQDGILSGLTISTSGVSTTEINVSAGKFRLNGRTYKYNSAFDIDDASISIDSNVGNWSRLDAIAVKPDLNSYDSSDRFYGVDFKVFKGISRSDIPVPAIDEGYIFLGFVLVVPNATAQDVLRPLPITDYYEGQSPLNISPLQFAEDLKSRIFRWSVNTLFLKDQLLIFDNNLYKVAYTYISNSSSIYNDININALTSVGAMTNSNIAVFSHVGSDPTDGTWINQYFEDWNSNTRILDAFFDISKFIKSFAPIKPNNISQVSMSLVTPNASGGISNLGLGNVATYIISDAANAEVESSERFIPYNSGTLKSYLYTPSTSYTTNAVDLSTEPSAKPNLVQVNDISNVYTFTVERDDHYGTISGYKGFYNSIYANAVTLANLTPSANSYRFNFTHLSSTANSEITFYVENTRTPNIANVENYSANTYTSVKYLSGAPVLKENDSIFFDFDLQDAVRYFYNSSNIVSISSEIMQNDKFINFANTEVLSVSNRPPFTLPATPTSDGPVIQLRNVSANVSANVIESAPQFEITGYNALNESSSYTTVGQEFLVDDFTNEVGVRLYSGIGLYPAGTANVDWGNTYTTEQSQANIMLNDELQLFGDHYFYPKVNYANTNAGINFEGNVIPYPNYNNSSTSYKWATFYVGEVDAEKFYNVEIRDAAGIGYDLLDGVTVTSNLKMFIRVHNDANTDQATGWLDINKSYNFANVANPVDDGDTSLDLSWMEGNPKYRRATFGTIERTGNVFVRIGTIDRTISFKDVVKSNVTPEESDSSWGEFNLGYIEGESYVVIKLNGTNGSIFSDFLNGTTMTSNFDIQTRVRNGDNATLGTDWIDANEAYPANGFKPVDYGDAALDLTYYSGGIPDATVRKISFGPTTRTGNLTVRVRYTGGQTFGNVTLLYPDIC